jgi:cell division protein FtsA
LEKIGRSGLLPAGIVITGGGSRIGTIEDLAKISLKLPSRVARLNLGGNIKDLHDSVWSVAYGLCFFSLSKEETPFGVEILIKTKKRAFDWLKQFLP